MRCKKNIESGANWDAPETTTLDSLTIAEGAVIKAPEGKSLTMTVDGVKKQSRPANTKAK